MSNKYSLIIFFLVVLIPLSCTRKSEEKKIIKDNSYLPLAVGNYWRYREYPGYGILGYDVNETRVIDTIRVSDTLFYKLIDSYSRDKIAWFLYKDSEGNIWAKDSLSGPSNLYQKKRTKDLDYVHHLLESTDSSRVSFDLVDTIEVPAGIFECLRFKIIPLDDTTIPPHYEWYSKGVGLIKRWAEIKEINGVGETLIKAKVNGVKYP